MSLPIFPGSVDAVGQPATLGVMGGGQLGRMFVHAAQVQGFRVAVLESDATSPAGAAADRHLRASYTDAAALDELVRVARECEVVEISTGSLETMRTAREVVERAVESRELVSVPIPSDP